MTDTAPGRTINAVAEAKTGLRFFIVSVGAFIADFAVAMALCEFFGLSLPLAATIAFLTAWFGGYLGHEYWTFRGAGAQTSAGRLTRNLISNLTALSVRVLILIGFEAVHVPESQILAAAVFLFAAGCSFAVNFLMSRFWVFARK